MSISGERNRIASQADDINPMVMHKAFNFKQRKGRNLTDDYFCLRSLPGQKAKREQGKRQDRHEKKQPKSDIKYMEPE